MDKYALQPSPRQVGGTGGMFLGLGAQGFYAAGQTDYNTGTGFWLGVSAGTPKFSIGNPAGNYMTWDGTTLSIVGSVSVSSLDVSMSSWVFSGTWSVTNATTIAWGAGTLTTSDGGSYSINAGNTGVMAARTYIYLDEATSTTDLQVTTTPATAIGAGKLLIAVAINGTNEAAFTVLDGRQTNIDGGNIASGSITTSEIAANTITASNIAAATITTTEIAAATITGGNIAASTITASNLTISQLSAIAADLGNITAGTIVLPSGGYIRSGQTDYDTGTGFWLGNAAGTAKFSIGNSAGRKLTWDGTTFTIDASITTASGSVISASFLSGLIDNANLNNSVNNWVFSGTWTVTDADTISWGAGTLTFANGNSYSIGAGNTGNMAAKTFVYLDTDVSSIAFQTTTTPSTAVGSAKVLIAICENGTNEASFMTVNDKSRNIDAAEIVAGSITANEIATSTITADRLTVSTLAAITADMGSLTAGTITLNSAGGHIKSGQTDYNTGSGFWLGNSGGTTKFSIGNPSGSYITWDGTSLTVGAPPLVKETVSAATTISSGFQMMIADSLTLDDTLQIDGTLAIV